MVSRLEIRYLQRFPWEKQLKRNGIDTIVVAILIDMGLGVLHAIPLSIVLIHGSTPTNRLANDTLNGHREMADSSEAIGELQFISAIGTAGGVLVGCRASGPIVDLKE